MRIVYFDCFSGASGDMLLGSLLDAGLALDDLQADLEPQGPLQVIQAPPSVLIGQGRI